MDVFTRIVWPSGALEISCPDIHALTTYIGYRKREAMLKFCQENNLEYIDLIVNET